MVDWMQGRERPVMGKRNGKFDQIREVVFAFGINILQLVNIFPKPCGIEAIQGRIHFFNPLFRLHGIFIFFDANDVPMLIANHASPVQERLVPAIKRRIPVP